MRFQLIAGALAFAGSSSAFSDSLPFVLLSTSAYNDDASAFQLRTSSEVLDYAKNVLQDCPTDRYLLVSQPGVTATDIRNFKGCGMPSLCRTADDKNIKGSYVVAEVVGDLSKNDLADYIKTSCSRKEREVQVNEVALSSLSGEDRASILADNDVILRENLDATTKADSYTVLFYATPGEPVYESDFEQLVKMDRRRHVQGSVYQRADNETEWKKLPLFEKYQFFTPGIFMGIISALVMFSILFVGLRALSSLEVSYGAFEKDMGPSSQKKQQ